VCQQASSHFKGTVHFLPFLLIVLGACLLTTGSGALAFPFFEATTGSSTTFLSCFLDDFCATGSCTFFGCSFWALGVGTAAYLVFSGAATCLAFSGTAACLAFSGTAACLAFSGTATGLAFSGTAACLTFLSDDLDGLETRAAKPGKS